MSRRETRLNMSGDRGFVYAAADFATTVNGARLIVSRGQRYSIDDPVVTTRPDLFRPFTPPNPED